MKKDKTVIPKGWYCYDIIKGKRVLCPYWSIRKDKPEQENGYCSFLGKGDWEENKEKNWRDSKGKLTSADEMGINLSLLWDQVKECGENDYTDEELDKIIKEDIE